MVHHKVKLIIGMICAEEPLLGQTEKLLFRRFGPVDLSSQIMKFDFTKHYEKEMGPQLKRQFLSFQRLIDAGSLFRIKLMTMRLEAKLARKDGTRRINLDPGYITESKLVLATTKNFMHRIFINKGIFAEVTLWCKSGEFQHWDWTYPDYRKRQYKNFFNKVRRAYLEQRKVCLGQCKISSKL